MTTYNRADMVKAISASNLPVPMRALALIAVNTMRAEEVTALSGAIDRVISLAKDGKSDEIRAVLVDLKVPPEFHLLVLENVKNLTAGQ